MREQAKEFFRDLQDRICARTEELDRVGKFREDRWTYEPDGELRAGGGGGITRVLAADRSSGAVFEKAGVNTSAVAGKFPRKLADRMKVAAGDFFATGLSLVMHPINPYVPTVHMNVRYIQVESEGKLDAWFGGGADLTPYYLYPEDAEHFHRAMKAACDGHEAGDYPRFKKWCDEYFFLEHRDECRGIGGIFFDYLRGDLPSIFPFVKDAGEAFLEGYAPIVERRRDEPFGEAETTWQQLRRGRYAEFNLVYDRGTIFGLETKGRTESILMSLPPTVRWAYDYRPEQGSREAELIDVLRNPRDWI